MKPSRQLLAAATTVLLGLAPVTMPTVARADASGVALPIAHFSHFVVDQAHGHLFFSGGSGVNEVLVTTLDGTTVTTLPQSSGATGLALSADGTTLYAALPDSDAIAVIDTATLTQTATRSTGTRTHPDSLAIAGGTLWFGYGTTGTGGIGSMSADGTVTLAQDPNSWPAPPTLGTTPQSSNLLAAAAHGTSNSAVSVFTAAPTGLTRSATAPVAVSDGSDLAITPDGQSLALAVGSYVDGERLRLSDLSQVGSYATMYPVIALAPDGAAAVADSNAGYAVFDPATGLNYNDVYSSYPMRVASHGLALAPDGSRVFAVLTDNNGNTPTLQFQTTPEISTVTPEWGTFPAQAAPGEPFATTIWLRAGTPLAEGTLVHVTRIDPAHPNGIPLPDAAVISFSELPIKDTLPLQGPVTYRIDYPGDAHHTAFTYSFTGPITKYAPTMALTAPATPPRATPFTVTGKLTWPHAHLTTGLAHIVRKDLDHPTGISLGTATVAADGTFSFRDAAPDGGANTYTATYDGGTTYLPVTASTTVQVARLATSATVTTNKTVYNYGETATVTAHLGTHYNGRQITLFTATGYNPPVPFQTGTVDAHGNLTATFRVTHNTSFGAAFAGDDRYAPITTTTPIHCRAEVIDRLHSAATATSVNGTSYAVYYRHQGVYPLLGVTVAPGHIGGLVNLYLQHYVNGSWQPVWTLRNRILASQGLWGYTQFNLPMHSMANNGLYRAVAWAAGDTDFEATTGNYVYLTIRP